MGNKLRDVSSFCLNNKEQSSFQFLKQQLLPHCDYSAVGPAVTSSVGDVTLGDSEKSPFPPSPVITSECILSDGH